MARKVFNSDQERFEWLLFKFVDNRHPYGYGEARLRYKALLEWASQKGITLKRLSPKDLDSEFELKPDTPPAEPVVETVRKNFLDELEGRN